MEQMVFVKKPPFRGTRKRGFLSWIGFFMQVSPSSQAIQLAWSDELYFAAGIIKSSSLVSSSDQLASSS